MTSDEFLRIGLFITLLILAIEVSVYLAAWSLT